MSQDPARDHHTGSVIINGEKYPLPAQVIKNIETVINLQTDQERRVPASERILSKITAAFGRSRFLYSQLAFFAIWGLASHFAQPTLVRWDLPVMDLQSHGLDMAALLITTGVLVRQTQQDKIAERRSHLMLQINLLNEQKIAKVIELIEELRNDTPDVANRFDWEAKIMQQATDPQVVLNILQENLEPAHQPEDPSANRTVSDQTELESDAQNVSHSMQSAPAGSSTNSAVSAS